MGRLLRAVINSWNGVRFALRSEAAFRQELAIFVLAVPLAFLITDDAWKRLALIGVLMVIFVVELLNTAIEKLCDRVSREIDPQIGWVKDIREALHLARENRRPVFLFTHDGHMAIGRC